MEPMAPPPEAHEHLTETIASRRRTGWRALAATATGTVAVAGIVAVGLATGGGAATASPGAVAQETTTTTVAERPGADERQAERKAARTERLSEELQSLVDDGTITDAQRDAVVEELVEAMPERRPGHLGRGGFGFRGLFGAGLETAAEALGISTDDLRSALRDGTSIADVAGEKNVEVDTVIDALLAEAKAKLAEIDLPEGREAPTDEQLRDRITEAVNGELRFGRGFGHGRGDGPR